ncbi:hypothetical protein ACFLTD_05500, partial [Elusimicrobiota bacterium]
MRFLLVNPCIYDFACYDFWLKPLGLLYISAILKGRGHSADIVDCMDRHHRDLSPVSDESYGRGHYINHIVPKPDILKNVRQRYKRYGMSAEVFSAILDKLEIPDFMLLSSSMTYWYPGVAETARILKYKFPDVPLVLGGHYVTFCKEHAQKNINADYFFKAEELSGFFKMIGEDLPAFESWPAPDYSCYSELPYVCIRTTVGCFRNCSFCGIKKISPEFQKKDTNMIADELDMFDRKYGVRNIVFYDDSLLDNE